MDIENEIEILESALGYLEMAIGDITDSPYHSYLAESWGLDVEELRSRHTHTHVSAHVCE